MNFQSSGIYLLLIAVFLFSCRNKEQEQRLLETAKRLEQQNEIGLKANNHSEDVLHKMITENYIDGRYDYLTSLEEDFAKRASDFSQSVSNTLDRKAGDSFTLFSRYQQLQEGYKALKQKMIDSFPNAKFEAGINGFMELDEKAFHQKYLGARDSINSRLALLFLHTDAILNENLFITRMIDILTSEWHYDPLMAIAVTDKTFYRSGEKMQITAALVTLYPAKTGYLVLDGKRIESDKGIFQFSRKVSGKPGLQKSSFIMSIRKEGREASYPAAVTYKVE